MSVIYLGIDPGLSGAVAELRDGDRLTFFDTPTVSLTTGKKTRRDYDIPAMDSLLCARSSRWFGDPTKLRAAIEDVNYMPGPVAGGRVRIGAASAGMIGKGFGIWLALLVANGIPYTIVPARKWKADMMHGMPKGKDASVVRCLQMFPRASDQLRRVKDHNRADAALIAAWLRRYIRT